MENSKEYVLVYLALSRSSYKSCHRANVHTSQGPLDSLLNILSVHVLSVLILPIQLAWLKYFLSSLLEYLNGKCSFSSLVLSSSCSPYFLFPTPLCFYCSLLVSWALLMSSVRVHSLHSLIPSHVTPFICALCLILFILGHFLSIPDWTSPIFFSLFFSRLSLFYCFGSMKSLICFPSPFFNSIGQLYLLLSSLVMLCSSLLLSSTTSMLITNSEYENI